MGKAKAKAAGPDLLSPLHLTADDWKTWTSPGQLGRRAPVKLMPRLCWNIPSWATHLAGLPSF